MIKYPSKKYETSKIKVSQLPLIVKIMIVCFVVGWAFKVLVLGAYLIVNLHDGTFNQTTNNIYLTKHITEKEYLLYKELCSLKTNGTYLNYDEKLKTCYTPHCENGEPNDDFSNCRIESIPFNPQWNKKYTPKLNNIITVYYNETSQETTECCYPVECDRNNPPKCECEYLIQCF